MASCRIPGLGNIRPCRVAETILAGKYLPAPEDFLRPGDYVDEYGNISYVGVADWQDLIYQNGFSQEYNISVSGGSTRGALILR